MAVLSRCEAGSGREKIGARGWRGAVRPGSGALLCLTIVSAIGCAGTRAPWSERPEPVPYADTLPIPEPRERDYIETIRLFKQALGGELLGPFDLRRLAGDRQEALNITRFDDVVSSAWFEHRNGRRRMTSQEVARGAAATDGPDTSRVLTVIAGKAEGISPGFTVRDARGDVYLFKFDPKGNLHLASAADVIASRLFYAAGYHTPEDFIAVFDSSRLELDPEAEITTERGERRMVPDDIRALLSRTDALPDGRYLALASKFLAGTPKGPFLFEGRRSDDPNDHYRHEHRRELRGLYVVSAWLNHVDMRFGNTLDTYVEPGYLKHHLIDFAASLGSGTLRPHRPREGREHNFDLWPTVGRILSLGFYSMGWEGRPYEVIHPSIGWLPVEGFDPGGWKPNWPNPAFRAMTVRDAYWSAKLVGSFTDEQIRAVVSEAHLPTKVARDTLAKIIAYRRDRTIAHWYARVAPLEELEVVRERAGPGFDVTFDDLGLDPRLWSASETRYRWEFEHRALRRRATGGSAARGGGRQRIRVRPGDASSWGGARSGLSEEERMAVLRVSTLRPDTSDRPATLHLRWDGPGAGYRLVGLEH